MKILLTGATGYIGRRLTYVLLLDNSLDIRILVRDKNKLTEKVRENCEIVEGSTFDSVALFKAAEGVDVAYYLIHSMGSKGDFEEKDRISSQNFLAACLAGGVKRIVYLGGLGDRKNTSRHLKSRIETGEILSSQPDKIETFWFRAGIIIGSGSASFEIIRNLVQKLPVLITPKWVRSKSEPIGIRDVLLYLFAALHNKSSGSHIIDIGCGEKTFQGLLEGAAIKMGLKRWIIPVPFFSPQLSSYWLVLFTPVPFSIASALVEGLKFESIRKNNTAYEMFPDITPDSYNRALDFAIEEIESNQILSRWSDSSDSEDAISVMNEEMGSAVFSYEVNRKITGITEKDLFSIVKTIGGENGWFRYHFLWVLRGLLDKLAGGYGLNRGRRHPSDLRTGDSIDFWKVVDFKDTSRLLLYAQMKLPGKGWLEFVVAKGHYIQTAYFLPKGLWGRLYWFGFLPVHKLIFLNMANQIIKKSMSKK